MPSPMCVVRAHRFLPFLGYLAISTAALAVAGVSEAADTDARVDACYAELLDDTRLWVMCGDTQVPEIAVDVKTRYAEGDPDPFLPAPMGFEPAGDPLVVDLAHLEPLVETSHFECAGKALVAGDDPVSGPESAIWDHQTLERVVTDVRRVQSGEAPRCFDIEGGTREPLNLSRHTAASLSEMDNLGQQVEDDILAIKDGRYSRTDDLDTGPSAARLVLQSTALGTSFRQEYDQSGRCPRRFDQIGSLEAVAMLSSERDFTADVATLIAQDTTGRPAPTATRCGWDPHKQKWRGLGLYCEDETTCWAQMDPQLPLRCQQYERTDAQEHTWTIRNENCFVAVDEVTAQDERQLRYMSLGDDVYLELMDTRDGGLAYSLVFPHVKAAVLAAQAAETPTVALVSDEE